MNANSAAPARVAADPQYPIGRFVAPERTTDGDRLHAIAVLAELPTNLRNAVRGLEDEQLDMPYREGGWTVRQLVHHIADSHTTAVFRVRQALTASWPVIQPYDEKAFAQMHDYTAPVEWSLELIEALHARWVLLLQSLTDDQWHCGYTHPENGPCTIERAALIYAWHSRHHVAHILQLRDRENWG